MLTKALELAAQINHPITAAIFAAVLALIALIVLAKGKKKPPHIAWPIAFIILILGLAPLVGNTYLDSRGIYRVRVQVLSPGRSTVHEAEISSSAGGEAKQTDAGWEFTIPREEKPANGQVTFRAEQKDAFLSGSETVNLRENYFPQVSIQLVAQPAAGIRGMVEDEHGRPIEGVRVWVQGFDEVITTGTTGSFSLGAHAADGQQITLVAQKGERTIRTSAVAGRSAEIILRGSSH